MNKIMLNTKYGLEQAVLDGRKTMTKMELKYPRKSHPRKDVHDLTGQKFGKLTVLSRHHKGYDRMWYYECLCDCGNITIVRSNALTHGNTKSCGCNRKGHGKHNLSNTRLYGIWLGMKCRCFDKNNPAFPRYGGRGISICLEWLNDFHNFYKWSLSNGYAADLSIDRIDVNGHYEPANCRWATPKEQADNKTSNILITIAGETKNLQQWCDKIGIKRSTVYTRVLQCGWSYEKALTTPVRKHRIYKTRGICLPN